MVGLLTPGQGANIRQIGLSNPRGLGLPELGSVEGKTTRWDSSRGWEDTLRKAGSETTPIIP